MTKSFNCASCSAPLEFEGKTIQKCEFCGSTVIAPPEMFYRNSPAPFGDFSSLTGKALKIAEIDQLIHSGNKIEAIKVFRETFGVGLAEAKEAVERMARGESVDISGMQVRTTAAVPFTMSPESIDAVKKAGTVAGGFSLVIGVLILIITVSSVGIGLYFAFSGTHRSAAVASNTDSEPSPKVTGSKAGEMSEMLKIGGEGNGPGRFEDNRHVAVDGKGRIYSSDYSPHRVQVFDAEGKFINQWNPVDGDNLYGLAADREGNVYLANNDGIFKHEGESGKLIAKVDRADSRAMALTWDGKLVSVNGKVITIYDKDLKLVSEYKDAGDRANSTFGFDGVAIDGNGVIYAADRTKKEICKFSADGKFLDRFANPASSNYGMAFDPQGRLFVSNVSNIFVLDADGKQLKLFDSYQAFGLAFDQSGDLYVAARPHVIKHKLNF